MHGLMIAIGLMAAAGDPAEIGLARGTVATTLVAPSDEANSADRPFADAVGQAFGAAGFTLLPGHSRYVAEVSVERTSHGVVSTRATKDPASAGIGSWGPSVRLPLGSKKTVLRDLVTTTLTVRLVNRADHARVWSASAVTAGIADAPVAAKLARAAVSAYPQTLATPVSVP